MSVPKCLAHSALALLLVFGLAWTVNAQDHADHEAGATVDYLTEYIITFDGSAEKIGSLSKAIPEDKYDWRPAEGVRSVKESMMHVAAANFFLATRLGADLPEDLDVRTLESMIEGKDEALKVLMRSFDHVRTAVGALTAADLGKEVDVFGNPGNMMRVLMIISEHMAEHQGQLIAYARMNDVVPPWSKQSE